MMGRTRRRAEHSAQRHPTLETLLQRHRSRDRNTIERMFCRLKDIRRVATRYDKLAVTYLAAVSIAATIAL
jgi:transposase